MQLEVGAIVEGKVTGITKFGAFVELCPGQTGMVHISEIAPVFVKEIRDFVTEGQQVKVKVMQIGADGKIALSMKAAMPPPPRPVRPVQQGTRSDYRPARRNFSAPAAPSPARPGNFEWHAKSSEGDSFEDMMTHFKQTSDDKISDLKRNTETRRGGYSKRGQK